MPRPRCDKVPLCDYADPLVKDLRRLVPAALKRWDAEAIHESRVATRRLRAALDLIEPMVTSKAVAPLRKTLKRLRRRLGPLRDLDVMIEQLSMLRDHPRHGDAARWLTGRLEDHRRAERRRAGGKKNAPAKWLSRLDAWDTLRGDVTALGDGVEARMRSSMLAQWRTFAGQADRLTAHLLDGDRHIVPDPHELRIAGKLLRYTFEMLAKTRRKPPAAVKRAFKRMQDELGQWHDHVVLAEAAMRQSLDGLLAHHDPDLQAQVLSLATVMLRTAEHRLRRFAKLWRAKGPALSDMVGDAPPVGETTPDDAGLFDAAGSMPQPAGEPPMGESSAA